MDLHRRISDLASFLKRYHHFWSEEVINHYPNSLDKFPGDWLETVSSLNSETNYALEYEKGYACLSPPSLAEFWQEAQDLSELDDAGFGEQEIPAAEFIGVKKKKQHEIAKISSVISRLHEQKVICGVTDFCGGAGFAAQTLAHVVRIPVTSVDRDGELQESGKKRDKHFRPPGAPAVEYIQADLLQNRARATSAVRKNFLSFGLHTCGELAATQFSLSLEQNSPAILNFGCCYDRSPTANTILSAAGKSQVLPITSTALTLASRSHREGMASYLFSKRVRLYRYMIHLFLFHELGIHAFISLGNSSHTLYRGSFADYGLEQLRRAGHGELTNAEQTLAKFFSCPHRQKTVQQMIAANLLRAVTGRPLEVYILSDRALYLEELGYRVKLAAYFDERISPRNLGILAIH